MTRLPVVTASVVVKALLVVSLCLSASFRWTLTATRTALEVALEDFTAVDYSNRPIINRNTVQEETLIGVIQHDIRQSKPPVQTVKFTTDTAARLRTTANSVRNVNSTTTTTTTESILTCQSSLLQRSLQRMPGYIEECSNDTFYGYVLRDLSNRFLFRSVSTTVMGNNQNKTIAVVSSNAKNAFWKISKSRDDGFTREEMIRQQGFQVGTSIMVDALWYNHTAVALDEEMDDDDSSSRDGNTPENVFLLVIDTPSMTAAHDKPVSPNVQKIISSETTRYAILPVIARTKQHFLGLENCQLFLDAGYKLQILSSSHVVDGINPYPPNTLLKSKPHIHHFLKHGQNLTSQNGEPFYARLFATRGWELAIPSRKEYINMTGFGNDYVIDVDHEGIPFRQCPIQREASIAIRNKHVDVSCFDTSLVIDDIYQHIHRNHLLSNSPNGTTIQAELWLGHSNMTYLEAACVKCTHQSPHSWKEQTACTTRAPAASELDRSFIRDTAATKQRKNTNVLAIEIQGLVPTTLKSWPSMRHILSLESLGFEAFTDSAVIDQMHPEWKRNETELEARRWWKAGKEVFFSSTKCHGRIPSHQRNSNITIHGQQVQDMFCFNHDHPHCLGEISKPQLLLDAATQSIQRWNFKMKPWATFLSFSEGRDDETKSLIDSLDIPLTNFISKLAQNTLLKDAWDQTTIAIYNNDAKNPVLFLKQKSNRSLSDLKDRSTLLLDDRRSTKIGEVTKFGDDPRPSTTTLPGGRSWCDPIHGMNDDPCEDSEKLDVGAPELSPPSILSFYADIPRRRKLQLLLNQTHGDSRRAEVELGCMCATNVQTWFDCPQKHPWEIKTDFREYFIVVDCPNRPMHLEMRMLPNEVLLKRSKSKRKDSGYSDASKINILFLEIDSVSQEYANRHFPRTRELLRKYRIQRSQEFDSHACLHGLCSADFSEVTLVGANSIPNQVAALAGCLSSSTKYMCGLQGKSIGETCNDTAQDHFGLRLERVRTAGEQAYWCPPRDTQKVRTPWIFGVLDNLGYINFFGEEFCYDASPYVTQGNVFSRFYQDIESHHVFCRLAERKILSENLTVPSNQRWGVNLPGPCVDGWTCMEKSEKSTISLQLIKEMWNIYQETPKFAFLNAIAAHDYSFNWEEMTVMAERYDQHLSEFLEGLLSQKNSQDTVVILRSDHGLQRGPMAMDYALQVEHRRPWTELLVPEKLIPSKAAFFQNQHRMTTGFDLYTTIRSIVSRSNGSMIDDDEGVPKRYSYDLLADEIPIHRTCEDAMVDQRLCRLAPIPREYGVCNVLDPKQANFCFAI